MKTNLFIWQQKLKNICHEISQMETLATVARLSLLLILFHIPYGREAPIFSRLCMPLLCLGLLSQRILTSSVYWLIIVLTVGYYLQISPLDKPNHKFLIFYWAIVLCLTFSAEEGRREKVLAFNGRVLIGLVMLFAVFAKLRSMDFMDGSFFRVGLVLDSRLQNFTALVTDLPLKEMSKNFDQMSGLIEMPENFGLSVGESATVIFLSAFLTIWTILIEGALALSFLYKKGARLFSYRHNLLILFALSTYLVANVPAFGSVLMIMGFSQCPSEKTFTRAAYLASLAAVNIFSIRLLSFFNSESVIQNINI